MAKYLQILPLSMADFLALYAKAFAIPKSKQHE